MDKKAVFWMFYRKKGCILHILSQKGKHPAQLNDNKATYFTFFGKFNDILAKINVILAKVNVILAKIIVTFSEIKR